jgi:steroid 5-alpha reductase family enzyme
MITIESIRKLGDVIFSSLVLLVAVTFFIMSFSLPKNSALMPRLVAILTAILDLPVVINIWREKTKEKEAVKVPVYTTAMVLFGYYVVLLLSGYIISSFLLIAAIARLMGQKNWIATIALSVIVTGITYYVFSMLFHVELPKGLLFGV